MPRRAAARKARAGWFAPTSLGAKLVLLLAGVGIAGAVGITLLLALVITPSFERLEEQAIGGRIEHVRAILDRFGAEAEDAARAGGEAGPAIQGVVRIAPEGRVVAARWQGPEARTLRRALERVAHDGAARLPDGRDSAHFHARLADRVAAIGVARVRTSDAGGGSVLTARTITARELSDSLRNDVALDLAPSAGVDTVVPQGSTMRIAVPVAGPDGRAVASVRFGVRREVSVLGRRVLMLAVAGSILLLLLVLTVLRRAIARLVLCPLARVEAHMQQVRESGTPVPLDAGGRQDEIGSLGRSFDAMLAQLGTLREQVEVQSFALGRSESAVAVMHNVRNALTPISTILSLGAARRAPGDRARLDRALAELAGDGIPAARRQRLVAFVAAALDAGERAQEAIRGELHTGREAMAQVLEIIGHQQRQAHERPVLTPVDVTAVVARNAAIAQYSQLASIAFSFPARVHIALANRTVLSQVIGNLLGNAAEAIGAQDGGCGSIGVTIREQGGAVEIRIRDDGEGFSPATRATLFQRGFSTRAHKSGGLGLHWCANAVAAMDGTLRLESEGPGLGATAILTLKAARAHAQAA